MTSRIIISKPKNFIITLLFINLIMLIVGVIGTLAYVKVSNNYVSVEKHEKIVEFYQQEIAVLKDTIEISKEDSEFVISGFKKEIELRDHQISTLNIHIDEMNSEADYIMDKYYYVYELMDKYNTKNPITLSNLVTLEKECKENNIDPHMVLGLYDLESKFNTQASSSRSSALGVAQIIKGTGKFLYNKYLGYEDTYIHSEMALDPTLSIEMSVAYLANLMNTYNDPNKALYAYNGGEIGSVYYEEINDFVVSRGLSRTNGRYR